MTELNAAETPSTVIDNDAPIPGGAEYRPEPIEPEQAADTPKPMSLEDAVKQAAAETKEQDGEPKPKDEPKAKDAKPEVKAEPKPEKVTPERGENGKFAPKAKEPTESPNAAHEGVDAEVEQERDAPKLSEARDINRAPAHFLPRAKEQWGNVPADVKSEFYRALDNFEEGKKTYEADRTFRKELSQFEDMAKQSNTSIPKVLEEYVSVYNMLRQDPATAVERLLATVGITPKQYAEHTLNLERYHQENPGTKEGAQLQQQNKQLQQQLQQQADQLKQAQQVQAQQHIENTLFAEVRKEHPRFDELRSDVALFFNSDKLSSIADERSRLFKAVEMAEWMNPDAVSSNTEPLSTAKNAQRPLNPAGSKSVKGTLSYGAEVPRKSAKLSLDEAIKMAARSVNG